MVASVFAQSDLGSRHRVSRPWSSALTTAGKRQHERTPETARNASVSVLSISPMEEDHFLLKNILTRMHDTLDQGRLFTIRSCMTLSCGLDALRIHPFEVVVCEQDLTPGCWKEVLDQVTILPDPPPLIVTARLADERLWAEALSMGAFDVLAKPLDSTETMRVISAAQRTWGWPMRLPVRQERSKLKVATAANAS